MFIDISSSRHDAALAAAVFSLNEVNVRSMTMSTIQQTLASEGFMGKARG
jgi:hypothetical protein